MRNTFISLLAVLLGACTINPVTGERELALVTAADEVAIGTAQYAPARQMQGGDYLLDPALLAYVRGVGERLGAVSDRALPYEFTILNSSVPNAWALPGGKIAVNRGLLLELNSEAELAAVIGHEIVHAAARHGALALQRGLLLQGALLVTGASAQRSNFAGLVVGAASVGAQLLTQRYGREAELEADHYGMIYMSRAGYDPRAAITLQETFVRLSADRASDWLSGLFASHPPSNERVQQNRATASQLPASGELGRERYQTAVAGLLRSRPAYDAYDQARAAYAAQRFDESERLAREALRAQPAEAEFHALLGDIEFQRQHYDTATRYYTDAITRNDKFFYYLLRRGMAQQKLAQLDAAQASLEASIALLPTADAYYALGGVAEQRGDNARALEWYAQAAGSSSPAGLAAQDAVVRLDLPTRPGDYLKLETRVGATQSLLVTATNPTRLTVGDVVVVVRYTDTQGTMRDSRHNIARLAPGASTELDTALRPLTGTSFSVVVASARVLSDTP